MQFLFAVSSKLAKWVKGYRTSGQRAFGYGTHDYCPALRSSHTKDCLALWKPEFVLRCCTSWLSWGPPFCQACECEPMPSWPLVDCWVRQTLMWQTVSDCRSRLSRCLLVMNCCALQSSIFVWIPSEVLKLITESIHIMQLHVVLLSIFSRTIEVLEWFKVTTCLSRLVAK